VTAPALSCPVCGDPRLLICARSCPENLGLTGRHYSYAHCGGCGIISLVPPPEPRQLGHYYQLLDQRQQSWLLSAAGQRLLARQQAPLPRFKRVLRWLASGGEQPYPFWRWLRPGSVVDLGAGTGEFCLEARRRGWTVNGIEQSASSIAMAARRGLALIEASLSSERALALVADADNVAMIHVFEHVAQPAELLAALRRRMRPGARLILVLPNPRSLWRYFFRHRWYGWDPPIHVHHYSAPALRALLVRQGFRVLELRSLRRHQSLAVALEQLGRPPGRWRVALQLLLLPLMPLLALTGLAPELLCVAEIEDQPGSRGS